MANVLDHEMDYFIDGMGGFLPQSLNAYRMEHIDLYIEDILLECKTDSEMSKRINSFFHNLTFDSEDAYIIKRLPAKTRSLAVQALCYDIKRSFYGSVEYPGGETYERIELFIRTYACFVGKLVSCGIFGKLLSTGWRAGCSVKSSNRIVDCKVCSFLSNVFDMASSNYHIMVRVISLINNIVSKPARLSEGSRSSLKDLLEVYVLDVDITASCWVATHGMSLSSGEVLRKLLVFLGSILFLSIDTYTYTVA